MFELYTSLSNWLLSIFFSFGGLSDDNILREFDVIIIFCLVWLEQVCFFNHLRSFQIVQCIDVLFNDSVAIADFSNDEVQKDERWEHVNDDPEEPIDTVLCWIQRCLARSKVIKYFKREISKSKSEGSKNISDVSSNISVFW